MALYQLVYQSQSLVPFETTELIALLHQAKAYNRRHDISGILLYTPDGRFLQVLEGVAEAVHSLFYHRILNDPRHYNCRIFSEGPCLKRSFTNWSMGFRIAQAQHLRTLLGSVPASSPALLVPRSHTRPELMELLLEFVAQSEAEPWLEDAEKAS